MNTATAPFNCVSLRDAAARTGVSVERLRHAYLTGEITGDSAYNGKTFLDRTSLAAWCEARNAAPTSAQTAVAEVFVHFASQVAEGQWGEYLTVDRDHGRLIAHTTGCGDQYVPLAVTTEGGFVVDDQTVRVLPDGTVFTGETNLTGVRPATIDDFESVEDAATFLIGSVTIVLRALLGVLDDVAEGEVAA